MTSNKELLNMSGQALINLIPQEKINLLRTFVHEMNRRELEVRFKKSCTFDSFQHLENEEVFGYGFIVSGRSVPYFHPNRSFHDEIIWLNENVFYNPQCTFEDKLINAAIVKFYGPSNTINLITEGTGFNFIKYDSLVHNDDYVLKCMTNLENAKRRGEKIYGTTELRTSLQTESRNYTRQIKTPYDEIMNLEPDVTRKSRTSDMFYWFTYLGPLFVEFYKKKPTMEESFNFLTSFRGIGNYYGYHFSTNLARMPEIGTAALLKEGSPTGNLDENDDFVAPGVGAMETINWLYNHLGFSISSQVGAKVIRQIRDTQHQFFDFSGINESILNSVTETGSFTTFGCEISTCQFSVFRRLRESKSMALNRSSAPISQETIGGACAVPSQTYSQGTLF